MLMTRRVIMFAVFLSSLVLSAATAEAQTAVTYYFLEVSDADGKPVADAKVESVGSGGAQPKQTDERGHVRDVPAYFGDFNTSAFKISKPGYLTYEVTEINSRGRYIDLLGHFLPGYDDKGPLKVVLLKEPVNTAEREVAEAEQRRRELVRAVRARDVATVEKLLRARASPDADDDNIPAIIYAAVNADNAMIKALLAAGADVHSKGRLGRMALLLYLHWGGRDVDVEVVRSLVKAGADVNAADRYGETVLVRAKRVENPELVKLLEKAGAR